MNTGQMLLTLGALILLSSMILRFNRSVLTSDEVMYNSKYNVLASSLCVSLIEEARGKAFDQNTVGAAVNNLTKLSATLGKEGETYENFNDFDDFNNYVRTDSTMPSAVFYVTSKVTYVERNSTTISATANRTWHKMITVTVLSPSMKDPVKMSSTYSYWYYR